jgi:hypothetical protein
MLDVALHQSPRIFQRLVLPLLLHAFSPLPYRENASSISS